MRSPAVWVRLLPVTAFLAAAVATAWVGAGDTPPPAPRSAAPAVPREPEPTAAPARVGLAVVPELPSPLATPRPQRREPAPAAPVVATPAPQREAATPAVPPPAAARPAPPQATSTPAPLFDDAGSGPEFDDAGASP